VELGGLDEREVDPLVTAWLGTDAPGELTGSVVSDTGGNPFFVEEVLRQLREGGGTGVPDTVKEVLAGRLARLGEDARDTLLLAAAAGPEIDAALLDEASDLSREEVAEALDAALAAHLIREEARGYAFTHALVREAIYEQVSAPRRALLHGRLAAALERTGAGPAELARHYRLAGGPAAKAVEYSARAAAAAMGRLAYEEAARHYDRAMAIPGDRRGELLAGLGEAHLRAGEVPASRESFSAAAAAARERGDAALLARAALGRSGLSVTVLGHDPETVALLEEALAATTDDALRARLLGRLAIELYHSPPVARREQLSADAVALARRGAAAGALADALSSRHVALWSPPHLDERLALADEMIALGSPDAVRRAATGASWICSSSATSRPRGARSMSTRRSPTLCGSRATSGGRRCGGRCSRSWRAGSTTRSRCGPRRSRSAGARATRWPSSSTGSRWCSWISSASRSRRIRAPTCRTASRCRPCSRRSAATCR
jgi:tetratricopeptide (TPR) repeat protein